MDSIYEMMKDSNILLPLGILAGAAGIVVFSWKFNDIAEKYLFPEKDGKQNNFEYKTLDKVN